ncbi:MAG TPA: hypothetical protein PKY82_22615 [Pyrinomonadaceae bacterium]|nr:hypothetical protein [Pyrinomonadaceae bacterium]
MKEKISKYLKAFILLAGLTFGNQNIMADGLTDSYIGYRHKGVIYGEKLPNGVKDLGGGLLSNDIYGVTRFTKGKVYMLWLEKILDRDSKGVPDWIVKVVLVFSELKPNQEFLFSLSSPCSLNGKKNYDLIVLGEKRLDLQDYKILKAWWANVKKEKFEKIQTKGIVCKLQDEISSR